MPRPSPRDAGIARRLLTLAPLLSLALLPLAVTNTAAAAAIDPRLGAPFEKRERPVVGSDQAPIVVIEFGSYKCGHCRSFQEEVFPALQSRYIVTNKVQWYMVPASDDTADEGSHIFEIGRCALRQGKFWDALPVLMKFANRPASFLDDLVTQNSTLDASDLAMCLQDRGSRMEVTRDFDEYRQLKIKGTPTFIVRKRQSDGSYTEATVRGYQTAEYFQRMFDQLLKSP